MYVKTFGKLPEIKKVEEDSTKIDDNTLKKVELDQKFTISSVEKQMKEIYKL